MNIRIIGKEDLLSKHLKSNSMIYIFLLIIFLIGIVTGSIYYKHSVSEEELSSYLQENFLKWDETSDHNTYEMLKETMIKNIGVAILFWLLGASVIGLPILLFYMIYKGFTLGFTLSTILATFGLAKGNLINFIMLFFQNVIFVPIMMIAMVSAIRVAINLLKRQKDIKMELLRHTLVCVFCAIGFFIAAGVEIFFNSQILQMIL